MKSICEKVRFSFKALEHVNILVSLTTASLLFSPFLPQTQTKYQFFSRDFVFYTNSLSEATGVTEQIGVSRETHAN